MNHEKVWELQQPKREGNQVWQEGRVRVRDHDKQKFGISFLTEYTDEVGKNDWETGYFALDDVSYAFSSACDLLPTTALPRGGGFAPEQCPSFTLMNCPTLQ